MRSLDHLARFGIAERKPRDEELQADGKDPRVVDAIAQRDRPPERRILVDARGDAAERLALADGVDGREVRRLPLPLFRLEVEIAELVERDLQPRAHRYAVGPEHDEALRG